LGKPSRIDAVETKTLKDVLALNVFGALLAARESVKRISTKHRGRGGSIVFISSVAATLGSPGEFVWYAASKGAVDTLTIGLARELAEDGIRVNAVSPGSIQTDIQPTGRLERLLARVPMRRAGKPQDIAEAVLFLLSPASSYTTGAILRVSGGR